jgi:plastocyanin
MSIRTTRREFLETALGAGAVAGATGTAAAQETARHTVDMTDQLVFDPEDLTIAPGDTVVWENVGTIGHSVTAYEAEIPADAAYFASGGFDAESAARSGYAVGDPDAGDVGGDGTFEHTFEAEGVYEYFCIPHETVGMVGTVEVAGGGDQGGGGPVLPVVPDVARSIGLAMTGAFLAIVGLAYFFLKYGGDYGGGDEDETGR